MLFRQYQCEMTWLDGLRELWVPRVSLIEGKMFTLYLSQMEQDCGKHQNGWIHAYSQRSVEEHLQQTSIGDGGTHLVEFSDAMRSTSYYPSLLKLSFPLYLHMHWSALSYCMFVCPLFWAGQWLECYCWCLLGILTNDAAVEKALRQLAESKGRAQDEAAEWKRKYEMERLRAASLEQDRQQELEHCQSSPGLSKILDLLQRWSSLIVFLSELCNRLVKKPKMIPTFHAYYF